MAKKVIRANDSRDYQVEDWAAVGAHGSKPVTTWQIVLAAVGFTLVIGWLSLTAACVAGIVWLAVAIGHWCRDKT